MEETAVWVVGEDPLARQGLAAVLAGVPGVRVAAQLAADDALAAGPGEVEAAVWDLGPPSGPGVERLRELAAGPDLPVLALAADEVQAAEALAAGARGVLPRTADGERLGAALRALLAGMVAIDEELAPAALRRRMAPLPALLDPLTPRELEVLRLLSEGLSNKLIAGRLGISEHTAKFHLNAILGKLGAGSRTEALVQAARMGLVAL